MRIIGFEKNIFIKTPRLPLAATTLKNSVGVGGPCRSLDQFFIEGEFLLTHFPLTYLPIY